MERHYFLHVQGSPDNMADPEQCVPSGNKAGPADCRCHAAKCPGVATGYCQGQKQRNGKSVVVDCEGGVSRWCWYIGYLNRRYCLEPENEPDVSIFGFGFFHIPETVPLAELIFPL
jgi:hypothetical protein